MAVGGPQGLADWNARAATVALTLRNAFYNVQIFSQALAACPDGTLLSLGMVQADINTLRSAIADANDLNNVFNGQASTHLTGTYNYTTFLKLLYGVA